MTPFRVGVAVLGAVIAAALVLGSARPEGGGGSQPGASYSDTGPQGLSILAGLLSETGSDVRRDGSPPAEDSLDSDETAILLDPRTLSAPDQSGLRQFVSGGGRLILGGDVPADAIEGATGVSVLPGGAGGGVATPLVPVRETASADLIDAPGARFAETGSALPIVGDAAGELAAVATVGEGRVILLADSSPLQNESIAAADNASFALDLIGDADRTVVFVDEVGGPLGAETGLAALPGRWTYAALLILAAALLYVASRLRRLGAPDVEARTLPPPRVAYVDALARAVERTGGIGEAADPLREEARRRVLTSSGLEEGVSADILASAAARQGLDPDEGRGLSEPVADEDGAVRAGTALAKLWR